MLIIVRLAIMVRIYRYRVVKVTNTIIKDKVGFIFVKVLNTIYYGRNRKKGGTSPILVY